MCVKGKCRINIAHMVEIFENTNQIRIIDVVEIKV